MGFDTATDADDTYFEGQLFEFDATLIPVMPGDVLEPRYGIPIRRPGDGTEQNPCRAEDPKPSTNDPDD